ANTIKALSRNGVGVGFIGKIAADDNGDFFASTLERVGVKTFLTRGEGEATGVANTFISPDGQRTFATYLGISGSLGADEVKAEMLDGYDIVFVEGYLVQNRPLVEFVMSEAKKRGMEVCLDLASYNIVEENLDFFNHLLKDYVDIVFANEEESRALTSASPEEALALLSEMCETSVVKLGARGSSARRGTETAVVAAQKVEKVVDTTGAGDYFAAGFLEGYIKGESLADCLARGGGLSAEVIQVIGCPI
ncbi:MAG: adenosine kinase, partial [Bacteroidaceae bacterium]